MRYIRPRASPVPLTQRVVIRVSGNRGWWRDLDLRAARVGMSRSEFVRWGVQSAFVPPREGPPKERILSSSISADVAFADLLQTLAKRAGMEIQEYIRAAVERAKDPPARTPEPVKEKRPRGRPKGSGNDRAKMLRKKIEMHEKTLQRGGDSEFKAGVQGEIDRMRGELAGLEEK